MYKYTLPHLDGQRPWNAHKWRITMIELEYKRKQDNQIQKERDIPSTT